MAINIKEIAWIAGLLEGEGCFLVKTGAGHTPLIGLSMTDLDTVERARNLLSPSTVISRLIPEISIGINRKKIQYRFNVYGNQAASWMMTIYPLMGERRKEKIKEAIVLWKSGGSGFCPRGHQLTLENTVRNGPKIMCKKCHERRKSPQYKFAATLSRLKNISMEEAFKILELTLKEENK